MMAEKIPKKIHKNAVLFGSGSIGDFLMFIYLSEMLTRSGSAERISMLVPRNARFLSGLLQEYPYISLAEISRFKGWGRFCTMLVRSNLVILHPTLGRIPLRVKILAWLLTCCRESELIGFHDAGPLCSLYSKMLTYDTNKPYIDTVRDLACSVGARADTAPPCLRFPFSPEVLKTYGLPGKKYIVFHPGASNPKRMFTIDASVEFISFIHKEYPEMYVVLSGGADESEFIRGIMEKTGKERIVAAVGTSAKDIASLIHSAKLFVGTDTGITHLACFLGARVIEAAHHGTANWLAFYSPQATVLYRLANEEETHTGEEYLHKHAKGAVRPFGAVPVIEVCRAIEELLSPESR